MAVNKKSKSQIIEDIISKVRERMSDFGALTAEDAVVEVVRDFETKGDIKSSEWSGYVEKAIKTLLSRLEKKAVTVEDRKNKKLLAGARAAELAYEGVKEAEEDTDRTAQLRHEYKKANK